MVKGMHRILIGVIAKSIQSKRNWAAIVPMALYFLRCTPNNATRLGPFIARHGLESMTPLQVLYKSWAQTDLGEVDLGEWVGECREGASPKSQSSRKAERNFQGTKESLGQQNTSQGV